MPTSETNLAENSGSLIESHKGYDVRIVSFYFLMAALVLTLGGGLAFRQLIQTETYNERERVQSQRRVLVPGPRGNIYARDGTTILVGNRPQFSVVLYLGELKSEIIREADRIRRNYRESGITGVPASTYSRIARVSVVQRYLDQVNKILDRTEKVDDQSLVRHFNKELLRPYPLIEDLTENEFARLVENLPVRSPLQVYTASARHYPFGSAAAHALGYIRPKEEEVPEDFPGDNLKTFKMPGVIGKDGLEKAFDDQLQGEPGGTIVRVDPTGYQINKPIDKRLPVQGKNIVSSLDLDLQLAAEQATVDQVGAVVAIEVATGEVLALVSKPDYDLREFSPRVSTETYAAIQAKGGEFNRAITGLYPAGSTFKILTTIAAFRRGAITPDEAIIDCDGFLYRNGRKYVCYNGIGHHHDVLIRQAIAESCDIYFYEAGWRTKPEGIAEEARRFHFGTRTGIEITPEGRGLVPDDAWKRRTQGEGWYPGDTANFAIGQGALLVTPLQMACFVASVARGEIFTKPTLIHDPARPPQHTEPIGITLEQRAAILEGMEACTLPPKGTAKIMTTEPLRIPGVRIAAKTGTAQKNVKGGIINFAWLICFAPVEKPEIAIAVMLEGDTPGEEFGGGRNSGPVASAILKKYFEKKNRPATETFKPFKTE